MKNLKSLAGIILAAAVISLPLASRADDTNSAAPIKPTPYPLTTCIVSGEKLGGDMGPPIVFVYQGQEIKFCCPMCKPRFLKDPDPYMKKIKDAEAAAKK